MRLVYVCLMDLEVQDPLVRWGVHEDFRLRLPSSLTLNFVPLRKYEYLLIALTHVCRCERSIVKEEAKVRLTTAVFIPEHDFVVGVSGVNGAFVVMRRTDLSHPLSDDIRTKQVAVFHILYSKKSSVLITIGQDLRIWNFVCEVKDRRMIKFEGKIEITQRARIDLSADMSMINAPCFNYKSEVLYIAGSDGFEQIDLDGKRRGKVTHFQASERTASAYLEKTESLVTADPVDGVCEWNWSGMLVSNHRVTNVSIVAVRFINSEFVFFLDANLNLNILDLMTSRVYAVMRVPEKPVAFVYFENPYPALAICFGRDLIVYKVVTPWKLWMRNVMKTAMLKRCVKKNQAARMVIQSVSSFLLLVSPREAAAIASASPPTGKSIRSFLYDRDSDKDRLFVIQEGGTTVLFATGQDPCPVVTTLPVQAAGVMVVDYEDTTQYCIATTSGELIICDYNTLESKKRMLVHPDRIFYAAYESEYKTVVVFFEHKVMRFDINKGALMESLTLNKGTLVQAHLNTVYVCYDDGLMVPVVCKEKSMIVNRQGIQFHADAITGISFGSNFFVTASLDCTVKIWAYNLSNIGSVVLPMPLYGVEILNGKRDLLVGTEQEIMRIPGKYVFGTNYENEDESLDNFNKKKDVLRVEELNSFRKPRPVAKIIEEKSNILGSRHPKPPSEKPVEEQTPEEEPEEKREPVVKPRPVPVAAPVSQNSDKRKIVEEMLAITHGRPRTGTTPQFTPMVPHVVKPPSNENTDIVTNVATASVPHTVKQDENEVKPQNSVAPAHPMSKTQPVRSAPATPAKPQRSREVSRERDAKKILSTMEEKERKSRRRKKKDPPPKEVKHVPEPEPEPKKKPERKRHQFRLDLPLESSSSEEFDFSTDDSGEERLRENEEKAKAMRQRVRRPRPQTTSTTPQATQDQVKEVERRPEPDDKGKESVDEPSGKTRTDSTKKPNTKSATPKREIALSDSTSDDEPKVSVRKRVEAHPKVESSKPPKTVKKAKHTKHSAKKQRSPERTTGHESTEKEDRENERTHDSTEDSEIMEDKLPETTLRDSGPRVNVSQDNLIHDSGLEEHGSQKAHVPDSGPRDTASQESHGQDSGHRENVSRENHVLDSGPRVNVPQEHHALASGLRENAPQESHVRDSGPGDHGSQKPQIWDSGATKVKAPEPRRMECRETHSESSDSSESSSDSTSSNTEGGSSSHNAPNVSVQEPKESCLPKDGQSPVQEEPILRDLVVSDDSFNPKCTLEVKAANEFAVAKPRSKSPPLVLPKLTPRRHRKRVRTPPNVRQQMQLVLPAPHIKLDKRAVIERYLNGDESLAPLVHQIRKQELEVFMKMIKKKPDSLNHTCPVLPPCHYQEPLVIEKNTSLELQAIDMRSVPDFAAMSHPYPSGDEDEEEEEQSSAHSERDEHPETSVPFEPPESSQTSTPFEPDEDSQTSMPFEANEEPVTEITVEDTGLDAHLVTDIASTLGKVNSIARSLSGRQEIEESDGFYATSQAVSMVVTNSAEPEFPVREPAPAPPRARTVRTARSSRRDTSSTPWNRDALLRDRPRSVRFKRPRKPEPSLESSLRASIVIKRLVRPTYTRPTDASRRVRIIH